MNEKPTALSEKDSSDILVLSFKEKISYGLGDFACNMSWTLVSAFLVYFYTDVYGLTPVMVGVLLLIARIWDGINDPIMGMIMERTQSRYGRFRPYLLYAPVVMATANIFTFSVFPLGVIGKVVYAYVTYICLGMAFTAVNIPYGALSTVMTQDHNERTTLNSYRMFGSLIATIVIGTVTMPIIQKLGGSNIQSGFFRTALVYSLISIPLFWVVFMNCKEVVAPPKGRKLSLKDSFSVVVRNKPLLLVLLYGFLYLSTVFGRISMIVYYCTYNLNRIDLVSVLMLVVSASNMIGILATPAISRKLGKRMSAIVGCLLGTVGLLIVFFSSYTNIPLIIFGNIIFGLGCFITPLFGSMSADCIEYAEWRTGARAEGSITAMASLTTKLASAFVGGVGITAIGAMGYVPNSEQTLNALLGINMMCNLVPAVMMLMATVPILFYKIDQSFYDKILAEIYAKRDRWESMPN